jgi:hypothetical protein
MAEVNSCARYRSGEGSTGRAWDHTGKLIYKEFPEFHNREAFTAYYANELKISHETIAGLSDYMLYVQAIYSYGFVDHRGNLLGIASIDVQGEPKQLDLAQAEKMVRALGPVLEAFAKEKTA